MAQAISFIAVFDYTCRKPIILNDIFFYSLSDNFFVLLRAADDEGEAYATQKAKLSSIATTAEA